MGTPRKPFDKDRLLAELKIVGRYGLRNKREMWRVQLTLAKLRKAARELLTLDETDPRRIFEGNALIRRIVRLGLLKDNQRHIAVGKQMVDIPSFIIRVSSEPHIQHSAASVF